MKILMCRPEFFAIEYEINAWMNVENQVDKRLALNQWDELYKAYLGAEVEVKLIDPQLSMPDMTFTANSGFVFNNKYFLANAKNQERGQESPYFKKWFEDNDYEIVVQKYFQGGEADALKFRDKYFLGYAIRTEIESHEYIKEISKLECISLKMINPLFYDMDTAFCAVGDQFVLYYPEAFDSEANKFLEEQDDFYAVNQNQAEGFICNSVLVDKCLFCSYMDEQIEDILKSYSLSYKLFNLSEFKKSGGGVKCLSLILER